MKYVADSLTLTYVYHFEDKKQLRRVIHKARVSRSTCCFSDEI